MRLEQYIDLEKLSSHINEGYVLQSFHRELPLVLYCYGRKAIWEDRWDDVTTKTRGLIVNYETNEIIARPFEKFFNIDTFNRPETHRRNLPDTGPIAHYPLVTDKIDGSLGTMYSYKGDWGVATKGSFYSDQAVWATAWLKQHGHPDFPWGWTPVFEIICETIQHHVVHYGQDRVVLLALINNETGEELPYDELSRIGRFNLLEVVKAYDLRLNDIIGEDRPNKEGYVVTWNYKGRPPFKLKVKHETFLKNQRILHTATPKNIFELVSRDDKQLLQTWMDVSSDTIRDYMSKWIRTFEDEYHDVFRVSSLLVFEALQKCQTRKDAALLFNQPENKPYAAVAFAMMDNTLNSEPKYKHIIWKMVKQRVDMNDKTFEQPLDFGESEQFEDDKAYLEAA